MVVEVDGSGLIMFSVLDQRLTLAIVVTMAGADMTVDIRRTFPLLAIPLYPRTVSDNSLVVIFFSLTSLIEGMLSF